MYGGHGRWSMPIGRLDIHLFGYRLTKTYPKTHSEPGQSGSDCREIACLRAALFAHAGSCSFGIAATVLRREYGADLRENANQIDEVRSLDTRFRLPIPGLVLTSGSAHRAEICLVSASEKNRRNLADFRPLGGL